MLVTPELVVTFTATSNYCEKEKLVFFKVAQWDALLLYCK